jgi:hypothetical protein
MHDDNLNQLMRFTHYFFSHFSQIKLRGMKFILFLLLEVFAQQEYLVLDKLPADLTQSETEICNKEECYPLYFKPTNEFQIVKPGQRIPKGLHVSIDYVTKVKKAKLMDESESHEVLVVPPNESPNEELKESKQEVNSANDPVIIPHESKNHISLTMEEVKTLDVLFQRMNTSETQDIVQVLEILSDAVHQIDIGAGLTSVESRAEFLLYLIHNTEPDICANAALVLGTAVSNNPIAQKNVLRVEGILEKLLKRFANVENGICKSRILFLITSLSRSDRDILQQLLLHDALNFLLSKIDTEPLRLKLFKYMNDIFPWLQESDLDVHTWCSQLLHLKSGTSELAEEASELYLNLQSFPNCILRHEEL